MARVMIADDSDSIRMVLRDILEIGHHELAAEAVNGLETVERFNATKPDLLLLDMAMPKKDGISALREILDTNPDAKIIMITTDENLSAIYQSAEAGAQAHIVKPFNFEDVLTAITMALN